MVHPDLMRPGDQDAHDLLVCLPVSWVVQAVGIAEASLLHGCLFPLDDIC